MHTLLLLNKPAYALCHTLFIIVLALTDISFSGTSELLVEHQIYIINKLIKSVSIKENFIKQVAINFIK